MKKYHSEGGRQDPDFSYQVRVQRVTDDMLKWCEDYDDQGDTFCRFYVKWGLYYFSRDKITFEQQAPAIMFALTFGRA